MSGLELVLQVREYIQSREAFAGPIPDIHPFLGLVARPNMASNINAHGFRGDPIEISKPKNTYRIFTLGGSTTFSGRLDYKDSYPAKLQNKLQQRYPDIKIEVQNPAYHWYTTAHSVTNYVFRVRKFQPDLIVVFHGINDLFNGFSPPWYSVEDYKDDYSHYLGPTVNVGRARSYRRYPLFSKFLLFDTLQQAVALSYTRFTPEKEMDLSNLSSLSPQEVWRNLEAVESILTPVEISDFKSINSFQSNLDLLIKLVKMDNHSIIASSQPSLYHKSLSEEERKSLYYAVYHAAEKGHYPDLESMIRGMEMFNSESYNVARKNDIPYVDLAHYVPKSGKYFIDDVHMTREGTEIVAQLLYDYIVNASMIK
jgi:hypothetical protein